MFITEILHKPLISIYESQHYGEIFDVLLNANHNKVAYVLLRQETEFEGQRITANYAVPFNGIFSVGSDAVTVLNQDKILDALAVPPQLVSVYQAKVFSVRGDFLGTVADIQCEPFAILLDNAEKSQFFAKDISSVGNGTVIVFTDERIKIPAPKSTRIRKSVSEGNPIQMTNPVHTQEFEEPTEEPTPATMPAKIIAQFQFLLGRKVNGNIVNSAQKVIIPDKTLITAKVVETARNNNRLIELTRRSRSLF